MRAGVGQIKRAVDGSGRLFLRSVAALAPAGEGGPTGEKRGGCPCAGFGNGRNFGPGGDGHAGLVFESEAADGERGGGSIRDIIEFQPTEIISGSFWGGEP